MAVCNHQRHGCTSSFEVFPTNPDDLSKANGAFYTKPTGLLDVSLKGSGIAKTDTSDQVGDHRVIRLI
jgi:hypothetical protein